MGDWKMRGLRAALIAILCSLPAGPAGADFWAERNGGPDEDFAKAVATDGAGNVYVTGSFSGTAQFGEFQLTSAGSSDIFVGKKDPAGNWVWVTRAGGGFPGDEGRGVTVDQDGNVYVTGAFVGLASFGPHSLTASTTEQLSVSPLSLVFSPADWAVPQVVNVSATNDAAPEGPGQEVIRHVVSGGDIAYLGQERSLTVAIVDDDTPPAPGLRVVESEGNTGVVESEPFNGGADDVGTVDTFEVTLTAPPADTVTVQLGFDADQLSLTPDTLVFDAATWNVPQTVSVAAPDDNLEEADTHSSVVTLTAASDDLAFHEAAAEVTVSILDTDVPAVLVSRANLVVSEGAGPGDTYSVRLATEPAGDVLVYIMPSVPDQVEVDPASHTMSFTPADWSTPQFVTVTAVDDAVAEGPHELLITHAADGDPIYAGLEIPTVTVAVGDNDTAGVSVSTASISLTEGNQQTYTVALDSEPVAQVTVTLTFDAAQLSLAENPLIFDATNWNVPQTVTVTAVDDAATEFDPHGVTIGHSSSSADPNYNGISIPWVEVTIADDDADPALNAVLLEKPELRLGEGASATYQVQLNTAPTGRVTIAVFPSVAGIVSVNPPSLDFTPGDWNTPQSFTVTALDDDSALGAAQVTLTHTSSSTDGADPYDGIAVAAVTVHRAEDDTAGVTVGTTDLSLDEQGGVAQSYTLVLQSRPSGDVTITIESSDGLQATTDPATVTFTPGDWDTPKSISVTAQDDTEPEGPHGVLLSHSVSSADAAYDGAAAAAVRVAIADDDPGLLFTRTAGPDPLAEEQATSAAYTVALSIPPAAEVTVTFTPEALVNQTGAQLRSIPDAMTFTTANWAEPRTLLLRAIDDALLEGGTGTTHAAELTANFVSDDPAYDSSAQVHAVSVADNDDLPGFSLLETEGGTLVEENGATDSYRVVLDGPPSDEVTISLTLGANGQTQSSAFAAKLDPQGNWLWARKLAGGGRAVGNALALGPDGSLYVTGTAAADASLFGTNTVPARGHDDLYVAKLAPDATWLWAEKYGTPGYDKGSGISVDPTGTAYVTGLYEQTDAVVVGPWVPVYESYRVCTFWLFGCWEYEWRTRLAGWRKTIIRETGQSIRTLAIGPDGGPDPLWSQAAGGSGFEEGLAIRYTQSTADSGHVYVTGQFTGTACFGGKHQVTTTNYYTPQQAFITSSTTDSCPGGTRLVSQGSSDAFVARYKSADGGFAGGGWATRLPAGSGGGADKGTGLAVDTIEGGGIYVAGESSGRMYVAKLGFTSEPAWQVWSEPGTASGLNAVAVGPQGQLYAAGRLAGTATLYDPEENSFSLASAGLGDAFVGKLDRESAGWRNDRFLLAVSITDVDGQPFQLQEEAATVEPARAGGVSPFPPGARWFLAGTEIHATAPALDLGPQGEFFLKEWVGTGSVKVEDEEFNPADPGNPVVNDRFSGQENDLTFLLLENSTLHWVYEETELRYIGRAVDPPPGATVLPADLAIPEVRIVGGPLGSTFSNSFLWHIADVSDPKLYPLRPVTAEIEWKLPGPGIGGPWDPDDERRIFTRYTFVWPEDALLHVTNSFPVDLDPASSGFTFIDMRYTEPTTQAATTDREFTAGGTGYSLLLFTEGSSLNVQEAPVSFEVVRTVPFDDESFQGSYFFDRVPWDIGSEIQDPAHKLAGENGFVLYPLAPVDAAGSHAAYDRETRIGQIIPVNRVTQRHDELVVVWYDTDVPLHAPADAAASDLSVTSWLVDDGTPVAAGEQVATVDDGGTPRHVVASTHGVLRHFLDVGDTVTAGGVIGEIEQDKKIAWPSKWVRYLPEWPQDPEKIIIASQVGSELEGQAALDPSVFPSMRIYNQPDPAAAGFNPNDEHALFASSNRGSGLQSLFALRSDLGTFSEPYVLLKHRDPDTDLWAFRVYAVTAEEDPYFFAYDGSFDGEGNKIPFTAGKQIQAPYPLSTFLPACEQTYGSGVAYWEDWKGYSYARSATPAQEPITLNWFYRFREDFFYDLDLKDGPDADSGTCIAWLDRLPESPPGTPRSLVPVPVNGTLSLPPVDVTYSVAWPDQVPILGVGETLLTPKRGLPDIKNQAAAEVVFDETDPDIQRPLTNTLARLIDPLSERWVELEILPSDIATENRAGRKIFPDLPFALRNRVSYDPLNKRLAFKGYLDESVAGDPLLLLNIMTSRERESLRVLSADPVWKGTTTKPGVVDDLYVELRNPNHLDLDADGVTDGALLAGLWDDPATPEEKAVLQPLVGLPKALTAGVATGTGYLTLAFNNDPSLAALPVSLAVIRVDCPVYMGEIKVIESDNVFDEQLTLRHSGDFGGDPDGLSFEWYYRPEEAGPPDPDNLQLNGWLPFGESGPGVMDITIKGPGVLTVTDNHFLVRYQGYQACGAGTWSDWAGSPGSLPADPTPQLAPGWIKRAITGLNPFEARVKDFHQAETNTIASMIAQAGERYEGPIALTNDPDALNEVGLIEAYSTVLDRGQDLSINAIPPVNSAPVNDSLLFAASRIADLYMLLGNEAFADAQDPTVGFGTTSGVYGTLAPTIFAFQNQMSSLLDEELALLRGRDDTNAPIAARPVYNRAFWNFTTGDGEVAYSQIYNMSDQTGDGVINEADARVLFPQGHGDAWGHYLTAIKTYYSLLWHPFFDWLPRTEKVLVAGVPVEVDFLDERKFARAAAARAAVGAQLVDLTYRQRFVDDPSGQWQGYKDTDSERAWGLSEWARRAGQGAYFDWVVGNAILPSEDTNPDHVGIAKVDRTTVAELREIVGHFNDIQTELDKADRGLNPLGLAKGVIPFDIDPAQISAGRTHFEQIYDRATKALNNSVLVFNYANQQSELLRRNQDSLDDFSDNAGDKEADFKNRLIEIYGYPYADDIGPQGTYPSGYDGPDLYHYMYVDPSELTGVSPPPLEEFHAYYKPIPVVGFFLDLVGLVDETEIMPVTYHFAPNGYGLVKPAAWTARRRAPGELQFALSELLQNRARLEKGAQEYKNHVQKIKDATSLLETRYALNAVEISVKHASLGVVTGLNATISAMDFASKLADSAQEAALEVADATAEALPKAVGLATDATAPGRSAIKITGTITSKGLEGAELVAEGVKLGAELAKGVIEKETDIALSTISNEWEVQQRVKELEQLVREEALLRMETYTLQEALQQSIGRYLAALAKGERTIQELVSFRKATAADVQEYRYQDMAFRIFRNDALQKYRAQFDLAARFAYLAATAYDYETNLLGSDRGSGRKFLTDIIRQRSLGQIVNGQPIAGTRGLADSLARMAQNFEVYKGQLGFNNPQTETNRFSLRSELLRLRDTSDAEWHGALQDFRVPDLWAVPEFRRFCRPFAPEEAGAQPGLVIPFSTTVTFGLNFFGFPLSGGDSAYDPTNFATRVRSVGVWFGNYNGAGLSLTPRVYLVPAGADVLRSPTFDSFQTREWNVVDQVLPVPFPLGPTDMENPSWIPLNDSLSEEMASIRRFSSFRARHDSGRLNTNDMVTDSRLIGRSVWNTRWLLIVPGGTLLSDAEGGLDTLVDTISDIKLFFQTYAYSGN